jgi:DNA-binding HxlR family transcriptional regulator
MRLSECPVRAVLEVIGGKWKPIIVFYLLDGTKRYGELRKFLPETTQKVLTQQLRELERDGILARRVFAQVPPKVEYSLTPLGLTLRPVMKTLCDWGKRHGEKRSNKVPSRASVV